MARAARNTATAKVTADVEAITPETATEWLKKNTKNRPIKRTRVEALKSVIERDGWMLNGESIIFDDKGRLIDGQYRLSSISESGCTCEAVVVRGVQSEAFDTVDTGRSRTAGDVASLYGIANSHVAAAVCRVVWIYEQYGIWNRGAGSKHAPTPHEIANRIIGDDLLVDCIACVSAGGKFYKVAKVGGGSGQVGAMLYFMRKADRPLADRFFKSLQTGVTAGDTDPAYHLRERLLDNAMKTARGTRLNSRALLALFIKAWNAHYHGEEMRRLRFNLKGKYKEAFPEIAGLFQIAE